MDRDVKFLLLQKIFWRQPESPAFDVRQLAVDVLGSDAALSQRDLNEKVARAAARLLETDIIALPPESTSAKELLPYRDV